MEIIDSVYTSLGAIGKDGNWIRNWIIEKPSRLGIGDIEIKRHDIICHGDLEGRLEILAYRDDIDTFYEIEIMLDECDANHGLRTIDYWSRERRKHPDARHVAVLVAENLSCRYRPLLEGLPQVLPFIGIDIKVLKLPFEDGLATILTSVIVQSRDLKIDIGERTIQLLKNLSFSRVKSIEQTNSMDTSLALQRELRNSSIKTLDLNF